MSRAPVPEHHTLMLAAAEAAKAAGEDPLAAMMDALADYCAETVAMARRAGLIEPALRIERNAEAMQHAALRRRGKLN